MVCITIVCVICTFILLVHYCTFIFESKETTYAEINEQNFVTLKMLMQNFFSQKNSCKNKSSKIFDFLVRVHNNKRLKLCRWEGVGE